MLEFQNIKTLLLKDILQIGWIKLLLLVKLKIQFLGHTQLMIWMVKKILWKKIAKTYQKELRMEKVIRRKGNKLYVKWKGYDNRFNSWIDKKDLVASNV